MAKWFLVDQVRTAYGLTPVEADRMVRQMQAVVVLDHLRAPEQSSAFYRVPFSIGELSPSGASHPHVALFNPAGSGVICMIRRLQIRVSAERKVILRFLDDFSAFSGGDVESLDFRQALPPKHTALLLGTFNGVAVGLRVCDLWADTVATVHEFLCILRPGTGLSVDGEGSTLDLFANFTGQIEPEQERPAP